MSAKCSRRIVQHAILMAGAIAAAPLLYSFSFISMNALYGAGIVSASTKGQLDRAVFAPIHDGYENESAACIRLVA